MGTTLKSLPAVCCFRTEKSPERLFLQEILCQEGYPNIACVSLDGSTPLAETLEGRVLALVSADHLSGAEHRALKTFLLQGGRIVMFKPAPEDLSGLGVGFAEARHPNYGQAFGTWFESNDPACHDIVQLPTCCDLYKLEAEKIHAWVASRRDERSDYPAIGEVAVGEGRLVIWRFDLAQSVLRLRQGDPQRASNGPLAESDGVKCWKPGALFHGLLDPAMRDVPQADVMVDVLVRQIRALTDDLVPLPRFWHYPDNAPAITLVDGDSDVYDWDCYAKLAEPMTKAGIPYTLNLMEKHLRELDRGTMDAWIGRGNDFQLHAWPGSTTPDFPSMRRAVEEGQSLFREKTGMDSVSTRHHTCVWPGYVETAAILAENRFRMETNYMPFRNTQFGYLGSGRAARFMTTTGEIIGISQQPTVFMDDPLSNNKSVLPPKRPDDAYAIIRRFCQQAANDYHTAICTCLHPVGGKAREERGALQDAMRQAVIDGNAACCMRAMTLRDWSRFHEAKRRAKIEYSDGSWKIATPEPLEKLTLLVPDADGEVVRQGTKWTAETSA
jgi:hypothetical protein